jgi:hypothetical protein
MLLQVNGRWHFALTGQPGFCIIPPLIFMRHQEHP